MPLIEKYVQQLLADIAEAAAHVSRPFIEQEEYHWDDIQTNEEEEKTAAVRNLQEWTGIHEEMLPPEQMLSDEQVQRLLEAVKKMLDAYNWLFVTQIEVPERIQYETIRRNFDQSAQIKRWNDGFFEFCKPGTVHSQCVMKAYCHCKLFEEMFSGFEEPDLTPEEERARRLEIELQHIKRKYVDDWMKYYPRHLDPAYDDEHGNPYDYGFDDREEDED